MTRRLSFVCAIGDKDAPILEMLIPSFAKISAFGNEQMRSRPRYRCCLLVSTNKIGSIRSWNQYIDECVQSGVLEVILAALTREQDQFVTVFI